MHLKRLLCGTLLLLLACGPGSAEPGPDAAGLGQELTFEQAAGFVDAQTWWRAEGAGAFGHLHVGTALAVGGVSGTLSLRSRVEVFQLSGTITRVWTGLEGVDGSFVTPQVPVSLRAGEQLERFFELAVDTTVSPEDGWRRLTVGATIQLENGDRVNVELHRPVYLANGGGRPLVTGKEPAFAVQAWVARPHQGNLHGYASVRLAALHAPPAAGASTWAPQVAYSAKNATTPRIQFATIDPAMHHGDLGKVVLESPPSTEATAQLPNLLAMPLASGTHKLFLRSSDEGSFPADDMAGVLVVPFVR